MTKISETFLLDPVAYDHTPDLSDTHPLPKPSLPDDIAPFLTLRSAFNNHFEKIELSTTGGSSMGYAPLIDTGTPDFYRAPESMQTGQYSLFESGEPMRDSLYRSSNLKFFMPLKNGDNLFLEFYSRTYQYPKTLAVGDIPETVKSKGLNIGIAF